MNRPIDPDLDDLPKVHRMDIETLRTNLRNAARDLAEDRTENRKLKRELELAGKEITEVAAINGEAILALSHDLRSAKHERDIAIHNQNAFYRYFSGHATGEDMERVKKFYEERHDRMIGYLNAAEHALRLILADPHGCAYCDSGKLRNPAKEHDPVCGYFVAEQVVGRKYGPLPQCKNCTDLEHCGSEFCRDPRHFKP